MFALERVFQLDNEGVAKLATDGSLIGDDALLAVLLDELLGDGLEGIELAVK